MINLLVKMEWGEVDKEYKSNMYVTILLKHNIIFLLLIMSSKKNHLKNTFKNVYKIRRKTNY